MSRDGVGNYSLPVAPFVNGEVISADDVNSNFADMAAALTESISKDGQTVPTASLPMGGMRHTGVGNATARDNYAAAGQVQDGAFLWCGTAGGTADALTLSPSPAISAYAAGQVFRFIASAANTGAATIAVSGLSAKAVQDSGSALVPGDIRSGKLYEVVYDGSAFQVRAVSLRANLTAGLFYKADPTTVAFTKTGAGTASIKAGTKVDVAGTVVTFVAATAITMPALTAGTDYAIWVKDDATIQAATNFSSAPGAGNWRKIGGFHYAPGGNASAQAGGDTTPAINAYSFWDLKFRPACPDPRGMTLVADSFWADIYLLGVDHLTNGTSKYNVTIADGSSPPKIPTKFGGSGSTAYSSLTWWESAEVMRSHGKRLPSCAEFAALAYGTTEASSVGADPVSTVLNAAYTSKWGVIQATGCMWVWGGEFGGPYGSAAWTANTGGRGSTYNLSIAVLLGGDWGNTSYSGSRCSFWITAPSGSAYNVGARGVCDHLILE